MKISRKKQILAIALVLGLSSLFMLVHAILDIHQLREYNHAVTHGDLKSLTMKGLPAAFAHAWLLHEKGDYEEALKRYASIETKGSPDFQRAVRYNMADIFMRQASLAGRKGEQDIATPLIELAKHQYRQLLRENSQHWQAKYNLEAALKILPDLDPAEFPDDVMPERSPESAGAVEIDRELP